MKSIATAKILLFGARDDGKRGRAAVLQRQMCCMPPSKASSTFVSYVDQGPAKTLPFPQQRSTASRQAITPEESNGIVFPAQSYDLVFQRLANVATRRFFQVRLRARAGSAPLSYAAHASTPQHRPV